MQQLVFPLKFIKDASPTFDSCKIAIHCNMSTVLLFTVQIIIIGVYKGELPHNCNSIT